MTKYLKQTAMVELCTRDSTGQPKLDAYGQPMFSVAIKMRCRKEMYHQVGTTGQGQFTNYTTTYYFDEATAIRLGDKVDGHVVQHVEEYVLGDGRLVGYEVQV